MCIVDFPIHETFADYGYEFFRIQNLQLITCNPPNTPTVAKVHRNCHGKVGMSFGPVLGKTKFLNANFSPKAPFFTFRTSPSPSPNQARLVDTLGLPRLKT